MSSRAFHVWTVLCRASAIDPENHLNLVDVLEEVGLGGVRVPQGADGTFVPLDAEIVSLWSRDDLNEPARAEGRVRLFTPGRRPAGKIPFVIDLAKDHRVHYRMRFHVLPFEGPGLYWFQVEMHETAQWTTVARIPLEVVTEESGEAQRVA